ncbi:MAG: GTPase [Oscillospiraceae bacterium]
MKNDLPVVALVGYTNAGKSTLLNRLTGADIPANDRLFDTLDTTTRQLTVSDTCQALLSDTVGFIAKLPHHLVEAFRATLEELEYADLLHPRHRQRRPGARRSHRGRRPSDRRSWRAPGTPVAANATTSAISSPTTRSRAGRTRSPSPPRAASASMRSKKPSSSCSAGASTM